MFNLHRLYVCAVHIAHNGTLKLFTVNNIYFLKAFLLPYVPCDTFQSHAYTTKHVTTIFASSGKRMKAKKEQRTQTLRHYLFSAVFAS